MKKLLFLFTALLFISCSGDDDSNGSGIPLSERLASMTSDEELFVYNENYRIWFYRFLQDEFIFNRIRLHNFPYDEIITNEVLISSFEEGGFHHGSCYDFEGENRIHSMEIISDTPDTFVFRPAVIKNVIRYGEQKFVFNENDKTLRWEGSSISGIPEINEFIDEYVYNFKIISKEQLEVLQNTVICN